MSCFAMAALKAVSPRSAQRRNICFAPHRSHRHEAAHQPGADTPVGLWPRKALTHCTGGRSANPWQGRAFPEPDCQFHYLCRSAIGRNFLQRWNSFRPSSVDAALRVSFDRGGCLQRPLSELGSEAGIDDTWLFDACTSGGKRSHQAQRLRP